MSVIIPTYQRREYVCQAVRSVVAQTLGDFELIVVDDGSTDGTAEALARVDSRLRYHWQENRGVAAARNTGLRLARGEVIAFLDSDNRWCPDHLEVVTTALARHPQAVLVTTCPGRRTAGSTPVEGAQVVDFLPEILLRPRLGYISCVAVRSNALATVGGFDERLPVFEDSDLWRRLAALGPVCLLPRRTIEHRMNPDGLRQRGARNGDYLHAVALSARAASREVRSLPRPDSASLVRRADAKVELVDAVRALVHGDEATASRALVEACRLLPGLSADPAVLVGLLRTVAAGRAESLALASTTARLWPEPRSDTARYLFAYSSALAAGCGRFLVAARYLARAGLPLHPGLLVRTMPLSARLLRQWLHSVAARMPDLVR